MRVQDTAADQLKRQLSAAAMHAAVPSTTTCWRWPAALTGAILGEGNVGLGGDFDGTTDVTVGLEDVSTYPALFAELLDRGWTESDCAALAGGNLLRAMRQAESFAVSMSGRAQA